MDKKLNVTKPIDMSSGISKLEEAVAKFEIALKLAEKDEDYYYLVIDGEYNRETCHEIEKLYREAGWEAQCEPLTQDRYHRNSTYLQLRRK